MKQKVDFQTFEKAFIAYDRQNHFPEGLRDLFDYLTEYERDTGEEIELDVIALCCDYTESKLSEVLKEYSLESIDELRDNTTVIMVDESDEDPIVIYQSF